MPVWAIKLGAGFLTAAALIAGYLAWASRQQAIGEARATAAYNVKIEAQKKEASKILAKETAKVVATERSLQSLKNIQEVTDAENKKVTDNLTARLRALGRLHDPNAGRGAGSGAASGTAAPCASNSPNDRAEAGGVFSIPASELLRKIAREADEINLAYISCRADSLAVRKSFGTEQN